MPSIFVWITALVLGCAVAILTAAAGRPELHMFAVALVGAAFAGLSVYGLIKLRATPVSQHAIAGATARMSALVWTWGALSILIIYTARLPGQWQEWWHFVLGFGLAALLSAAYAKLLDQDVERGQTDLSLIKIGRTLVILQAVGAVAGIASMLHDGKIPRDAAHPDWAACNIFLFGAFAIAVISIDALRTAKAS